MAPEASPGAGGSAAGAGAAASNREQITRRTVLKAAGLGALALSPSGAYRLVAGSGRAQKTKPTTTASQTGPGDLSGPFRWDRAAGQRLSILLVEHTYTRALIADLGTFQRLTGIHPEITVLEESKFFDAVTVSLLDPDASVDAFMTGAYMIWQYGPPGWLEDLGPWLSDPSATAADYDVEDMLPHLLAANRWNLTSGSPVGSGNQWAMPLGWESNVIAYQADIFAKLGLKPPSTFDELIDTAAAAQTGARKLGFEDAYGLAVRGSRSWATIHPGFMTQYTREGNRDFANQSGLLTARINSTSSLEFHRRWLDMIRSSGPPAWSEYTYQNCAADLANRRAMMIYDATAVSYPTNQPGSGAAAGNLAWYPGPVGPGGKLDTNLWVWSLAVNSQSRHKLAAWLFVQWATGRKHLLNAALEHAQVDPVRKSVISDQRYRRKMGTNAGYLETVEAVTPHTSILFTPQPHFFDQTTRWADSLQSIYHGADPALTLDSLAHELDLQQ